MWLAKLFYIRNSEFCVPGILLEINYRTHLYTECCVAKVLWGDTEFTVTKFIHDARPFIMHLHNLVLLTAYTLTCNIPQLMKENTWRRKKKQQGDA